DHPLRDRDGAAPALPGRLATPEDATERIENAALAAGAGLLRGLLGGRGLRSALRQDLVGRFPVDRVVVVAPARACRDEALALLGRQRADAGRRWRDQRAFHHGGRALAFEHRHQRLADAELDDGLLGVEGGVLAEGAGRRAHGALVTRG